MTIENRDAFLKSLPDWSILDGCWGGKIRPTDIDGCVQRGEVALFLEHKNDSADLKYAQGWMFMTFSRQGNTVLVFWTPGDNHRDVTKIIRYQDGKREVIADPSLDTLRRLCREWFITADGSYKKRGAYGT